MRWHYAVWRGKPFMTPACSDKRGRVIMPKHPDSGRHGITIVRGKVNCPHCLKAMGGT